MIYTPYTYTGWNGQVYNVQRPSRINKITHSGYFKNILSSISGTPLTEKIYLKSDDEFVQKSFSLPDYSIRVIKCKDTRAHNVLMES